MSKGAKDNARTDFIHDLMCAAIFKLFCNILYFGPNSTSFLRHYT